jgi:acetyl-CoA carboxylase biotin carboxyl carrier protein
MASSINKTQWDGRSVSINFNELRELLGAIAQTDITELTLKSEDFELTLRKNNASAIAPSSGATAEVVRSPESAALQPSVPLPGLAPLPETQTPAPSPIDKKWVPITSPMVGTFYQASAPDEAPFIEVNGRIRNGQTVCIIEAMKLMNEIEAEISGQVMEIVVANGEPVEYDQILMWINPD